MQIGILAGQTKMTLKITNCLPLLYKYNCVMLSLLLHTYDFVTVSDLLSLKSTVYVTSLYCAPSAASVELPPPHKPIP